MNSNHKPNRKFLPVTLIYKHNLKWVKMNHHAEGRRSFGSEAVVRTHRINRNTLTAKMINN